MNMLPNEIQIFIYSFLLVALMVKTGPVCGDPPFCGKKAGHKGRHAHEEITPGQVDKGLDFRPSTRFHGEIAAINSTFENDQEMRALKLTAYLKNRTGHQDAARQIAELKEKRAREKVGLF